MLTGVLRQARRKAAVTAFLEAGWAIAPGAWWDPRPSSTAAGASAASPRARSTPPTG